MICFPNCKINLGLHVINKRSDGFHNIETILYPVKLFDVLEAIESPDGIFGFYQSGIPISGNMNDNIVVKAYNLLKNEFKIPAIHMHLHKVIPAGAGLGGGSADGSFTLKLLNEMFNTGLNESKLEEFAAVLGSDCPFFIRNKPAVASGRGEKLSSAEIDLSEFFIVIVKPPFEIPTAKAYSMVTPQPREQSMKECLTNPVHEWKNQLINDFEEPVFDNYPGIEEIKNIMYNSGALYASMTGSGSAVYGIFAETVDLTGRFPGCLVFEGV